MRYLIFTLTLLIMLGGTAHSEEPTVPSGLDAQRIVSLAPNVTEMLFFLGLGTRVVGRTDFCNYPEEALALPTVGGFIDTSLEAIVALKPDLVVAYQGNSLELVEQLRQLGIVVLAFPEAATADEIGRQMQQLWQVASAPGSDEPVDLIIWRGQLSAHTIDGYPETQYFRCLFGYPGETTYTCSRETFVGDLMLRAGGINIVEGDRRWLEIGAELIVVANPEYIITGTSCTEDESPKDKQAELLAALAADPVWGELPAVKAGHLIVLDSDILLRPGPRSLDALQQLNTAFMNFVINDLTMSFPIEDVEPEPESVEAGS